MNRFSFAYLLGALSLFLYGLRLTNEALRNAAGDHLRSKITRLTRHRFTGLALGALMTTVLQSSTATIVMLIGLAGIGLFNVQQAMAVILGADLGTSILVLILASFVQFDTIGTALTIITIGFGLGLVFKRGYSKLYAQAVFGFGLIFFGLTMIASVGGSLRDSSLLRQVIAALSEYPVAGLLLAAAGAALVQSSAAVIGVILSLASADLLSAAHAVPFVLGANLGSTVGPLLIALQSRAEGKRIAFSHVAMKVAGIVLFLPFTETLARHIENWLPVPSYQVAAIHILFNVGLVVLFLPILPWAADAMKRLLPHEKDDAGFGPKYLDPTALESPSLAFANVFREILRMAEITREMTAQILIPFEEPGRETLERLEELDDQIDRLDREIKFYLARISVSQLNDEQAKRQVALLMHTHDLEQIGDVINKEMMELAEKKRGKNVSFSTDGWNEIRDFHKKVTENFDLAITSLAAADAEIGKKVIRHKKHLALLEQELAQKHLRRLSQGLRESFDTSSIHLDILSNLRRINSIASKLAYPAIDRRES